MAIISVLVPSLNVSSYIQQCLDSVRNQTFKDLEIICIDAGSTDGTLEIIQQNAATDRRIVLLHSDKKSYGYQVNLGLDYATGAYIGIIDSDDYIDLDMYNYLYNIMTSSDYDYVKCNYIVEKQTKKGSYSEKLSFLKNLPVFSQKCFTNKAVSIYSNPEIIFGETYIWNGLYRKSFLDENNIRVNETKGAAWQDIGFSISMMLAARKIFITDQYFNHYRIERTGNSSNNPDMLNFIYHEWSRIFDKCSIPNDKQINRYLYSRMAWQFAEVYTDALKLQDYDADSEYLKSYSWFRDILQNKINNYNLGMIGKEPYERVGLILENPVLYAKLIRDIDVYNNEYTKFKLSTIKKNNVVVFGSGTYGKDALKTLDSYDYNIDAFADNSESKWGTEYAGVSTMKPEECVRLYPDDSYVIANKLHYKEIAEQLLGLGIAKDQISYWSI